MIMIIYLHMWHFLSQQQSTHIEISSLKTWISELHTPEHVAHVSGINTNIQVYYFCVSPLPFVLSVDFIESNLSHVEHM